MVMGELEVHSVTSSFMEGSHVYSDTSVLVGFHFWIKKYLNLSVFENKLKAMGHCYLKIYSVPKCELAW